MTPRFRKRLPPQPLGVIGVLLRRPRGIPGFHPRSLFYFYKILGTAVRRTDYDDSYGSHQSFLTESKGPDRIPER